ncbi:glycoside hydrolase [Polyplosphaeria fusca]|uniref:Alpha-galactosidase n=1 Tax=Polyplosphaeria fusca TaxID=682080 RepID=A0A9P4QYH2_9PLEO|nr:glycoside hydrolase [Polyplosphaeria fusca]
MLFARPKSILLLALLSRVHALTKLSKEDSANGFRNSFRGWSSFPLQAYDHPEHQDYGPAWFTEDNLLKQARALQDLGNGYDYLMLDSGWSDGGEGDENGRIKPNKTIFPDFKAFSKQVHNMGLKLGVYIVPGAFNSDIVDNKPIADSQFGMSDVNTPCSTDAPFPCTFGRRDLQDNPASRAWVSSVVKQFADWEIDLIKFDYIHPKASNESPLDDKLPDGYSNFLDVDIYHDAISASGRQMWLLLSYNLDISHDATERWRKSADSYRISTDVNNPVDGKSVPAGITTMVSWFAIQKMSEALRIYMSAQLSETRNLKGFADVDSLMIGNTGFLNGLSAAQRMTYMGLWAMSGAPMYLGDDLTKIDDAYRPWLTKKEVLEIHDDWTSQESPGIYVNPDGSRNPSQLQIWEAGPFGDDEEVVVLLANMGCTERADRYEPPWGSNCQPGGQNVVATYEVLQLQGRYCVRDVWASEDTGAADTQVSKVLDEGQSVLYRMTPNGKGGKNC